MRIIDIEELEAELEDFSVKEINLIFDSPHDKMIARHTVSEIAFLLGKIPTIEAKPVVYAHWIYHIDDLFPAESTQECSHCHAEVSATIEEDNYCPSCGAEMTA